jgi:hypothetical protein
MSRIGETYLRSELERRQARLQSALAPPFADPDLSALLGEVDSALSRFQNGTYGFCETCHDAIERDRLLIDPLARFCLDDLTESERRALEHDLHLAARIQRGLLPPRHLPTPGWRVAYEYQPAGVASGGQFATLVVGRASSDGTVQLVNAGHLPVLHLSAAVLKPVGSTGVPLGMFSNAHFSAQNLFLAPGEALLVYTDGATEAQDRSGNEFGIERLKALASRHVEVDPETLITDCLESLKRFTAGRRFRDDFTMLAILRRR